MTHPSEKDRARALMMAALDGEIDAAERAELDLHLARDPTLLAEWNEVNRLKEVTRTMRLQEPPQEVWGQYWTSVYNRLERGIGWVLASIGAIVLLSYGLWQLISSIIADAGMALPLKLAVLALIVGLAILAVSVAREKLFARARDPYKEVER